MFGLASLFLSGVSAYARLEGLDEINDFIEDEGLLTTWDDGERHEATEIKLRFFNHGTKDGFDIYWLSEQDDSERFVTHLKEGDEYIESTYFGHNFAVSAHNFKVHVDVQKNKNPDNNEELPYLIKLANMSEEHLEFEFQIKSEYDTDSNDGEEDEEPLMTGESLQITTDAQKWFTIFDVNDTVVATFEILEHDHDEL